MYFLFSLLQIPPIDSTTPVEIIATPSPTLATPVEPSFTPTPFQTITPTVTSTPAVTPVITPISTPAPTITASPSAEIRPTPTPTTPDLPTPTPEIFTGGTDTTKIPDDPVTIVDQVTNAVRVTTDVKEDVEEVVRKAIIPPIDYFKNYKFADFYTRRQMPDHVVNILLGGSLGAILAGWILRNLEPNL
jgi:hypothetical protein